MKYIISLGLLWGISYAGDLHSTINEAPSPCPYAINEPFLFTNYIPCEVEDIILQQLPLRSVLKLREVSKGAKKAAERDGVWLPILDDIRVISGDSPFPQQKDTLTVMGQFLALRSYYEQVCETNFDKIDAFDQDDSFYDSKKDKWYLLPQRKEKEYLLTIIKRAAAFGVKTQMRKRCNGKKLAIRPEDDLLALKELQHYIKLYEYGPALEALEVAYRTKRFNFIKALSEEEIKRHGISILRTYVEISERNRIAFNGIDYILKAYRYNYYGLKISDPEYKRYNLLRDQLLGKEQRRPYIIPEVFNT